MIHLWIDIITCHIVVVKMIHIRLIVYVGLYMCVCVCARVYNDTEILNLCVHVRMC